ncbi:hypothetical protein FQN50_003586 [Emmonsiellopsis sp. PD_5]|nr:hypothetical protein FQN50_003586 [Emmonsiellopsis sp. PD_5]
MAASITSRNSNAFEAFSRRSKPSVVITLKDQEVSALVNSYTTLDTIEGEVAITADHDTRFENISITFEGTSRTVIDRPGVGAPTAGRASAFHTFLRLTQPIDEGQYPQPRIAEAGHTYRFPFTFVVPEHLLPHACNHPNNHGQVHTAHTLLPPSLGDAMVAGDGVTLLDDMTPQMAQIQYGIRAQLFKTSPIDGSLKTIVDQKHKLRIIPATDEAPPLSITDDSEEYVMRKEKDVKKGSLRGKLGRIVMAAQQPKGFRVPAMPPKDSDSNSPPTTMTTVHLRFDPINESQKPPRLGMLWSKLKVQTFYATDPWPNLASKTNSLAWTVNRGVYPETVPLASRCVASATWQKHTSTTPACSPSTSRRSSIQSTSSIDSLTGPSAAYTGTTYYTTTILVPISLPTKNRTYLPTFHHCLTARTYALDLSLSYHTPSANLTAPTISIRIPIHISSTESLADASAARGRASIRQSGADEFFTPRSIAPPRTEFLGQSTLVMRGVETGMGRGRSDTLSSTLSGASGAGAPPEYSNVSALFGRRLSNRAVVRTAC